MFIQICNVNREIKTNIPLSYTLDLTARSMENSERKHVSIKNKINVLILFGENLYTSGTKNNAVLLSQQILLKIA